MTLQFGNFPEPNRILIFLRSFYPPFCFEAHICKNVMWRETNQKRKLTVKIPEKLSQFSVSEKILFDPFPYRFFWGIWEKIFQFHLRLLKVDCWHFAASGATVTILILTLSIQPRLHWTKRMFMLVKIRTKISLTCKHFKAFQHRFNPEFNNTSQKPPPFRGFLISSSAQNKHFPLFL